MHTLVVGLETSGNSEWRSAKQDKCVPLPDKSSPSDFLRTTHCYHTETMSGPETELLPICDFVTRGDRRAHQKVIRESTRKCL